MPESPEVIPFRFKVSGNLIRKLGGESISNRNVAVLELIKNAYDARATKVDIELHNVETTNAKMVVSDNGDGMTGTDLENKWMHIATPNKSKTPVARESDRILIGEKGIGRLSSESLGKKTELITKPLGEQTGYKIVFDWEKYRGDNILCNEVVNLGSQFKKKKGEHGTTLEISELKHNWNDLDAKKDLLKDIYLVNPPDKAPKNFKIVPKFHQGIDFKKIRKRFLARAAYHLKAKLVSGNRIQYEFSSLDGKKKKKDIRSLSQKLRCGDAVFELYFYYKQAKYLKDALHLDMPGADAKEINDTLDEYSGIKLYRDNFRVKPYGEKGNDWIGLEEAAQNNSMCPRNTAIFGMVHISKAKNPNICDTTSREGVLFTDEFRDLISFVRASILDIFIDLRSDKERHKKKARKKTKARKKDGPIAVKIPEPQNAPVEEKFIDVKGEYPQNFYLRLEEEINNAYKLNLPNAALMLSRKMIECFIYDILEKKFPSEKNLWWSEQYGYHLNLSPLLKNLRSKRSKFKPNVKKYIEKIDQLGGPFRDNSNNATHNIYDYLESKDDLKKFKVNDILQLLVNVYQNMDDPPPVSAP